MSDKLNGIHDQVLNDAKTAVARGEASDTDRLIYVIHIEGLRTREVIRDESESTRGMLHKDLGDIDQDVRGIVIFGRRWSHVELALLMGVLIAGSGGTVATIFSLAG